MDQCHAHPTNPTLKTHPCICKVCVEHPVGMVNGLGTIAALNVTTMHPTLQ